VLRNSAIRSPGVCVPIIKQYTNLSLLGQVKIILDYSLEILYINNVLENRKHTRYKTMAQARIPHVLEGENLLKDISITGCCVESTAYADIKPETRYELEIEPEKDSRIKIFQLSVEAKWVKSSGYTGEIGFMVIASPKGRQFQRYVDYLAFRSSQT
jgi:hypothetical protein